MWQDSASVFGTTRLARQFTPLDLFRLDVFVHVFRFTADERLICLNGAVQFLKTAGLHRFADAMQHEPCSFLSDSKGTGQFDGSLDAILGVCDAPDGDKSFIEPQRRVLAE